MKLQMGSGRFPIVQNFHRRNREKNEEERSRTYRVQCARNGWSWIEESKLFRCVGILKIP